MHNYDLDMAFRMLGLAKLGEHIGLFILSDTFICETEAIKDEHKMSNF